MKKRIEMRPLTKREAREKQKLEQEQQALLEQWGVTETELKEWGERDGLSGREAAFEDLGIMSFAWTSPVGMRECLQRKQAMRSETFEIVMRRLY